MKMKEINDKDLKKLKWKGELTKGKVYSSYKLSVSGEGFGDVALFLSTNKGAEWTTFYVWVDKDWYNTDLLNLLYYRFLKQAKKHDAEILKTMSIDKLCSASKKALKVISNKYSIKKEKNCYRIAL